MRPSPAGAGGPRPLPVSTTSLLGRERAIDEVAGLVERSGARLVTLTGPGGVGKTRLAVAVGERLRGRFGAGTLFVPLETATEPALAWPPSGVSRAQTSRGRARHWRRWPRRSATAPGC